MKRIYACILAVSMSLAVLGGCSNKKMEHTPTPKISPTVTVPATGNPNITGPENGIPEVGDPGSGMPDVVDPGMMKQNGQVLPTLDLDLPTEQVHPDLHP